MRCRYRTDLVFALANLLFLFLLSHCNCGGSVDDNGNEQSSEVVRINNGYATKNPDGTYTLKRCDKNYADCNKDIDDGCEADLKNDRNNCGVCNNPCLPPDNFTSVDCKNSTCVIDFCAEGYIDLDKKYENGCEYKCAKKSDKENGGNLIDDDCDGYIDNVCKYAVDSNTYIVAPDMSGKTKNIVSSAGTDFIVVGYVELKPDTTESLNIVALNDRYSNLFSANIKDVEQGCSVGALAMLPINETIYVFWSENCSEKSKISFKTFNTNGASIQDEIVIYENNEDIYNIIVTRNDKDFYLSFETTENGNKVVLLLSINIQNGEVLNKRLVSTSMIDCYGHNLYVIDNLAYVSYWEMRDNKSELVIMVNDLMSNKKERYSIFDTEKGTGGTAIGYGNGYFALMWTETQSTLGRLYLAILDTNMQIVLLKSVDLQYDEFGLPVVIYNNIYGSAFAAMKNNKGYILFTDMDIAGSKISELIISPVSFINKPFMSARGDDFFVFYADMNSKMRYYLNMKRVYCIKN